MKGAMIAVTIAGIAMTAALVYGFALGDGWREVRTLVSYPWFNVSLVDVYVGFAGWIAYRESRGIVVVSWIIALCILGNAIACLYVLLALRRHFGDWNGFWLGHRAA